MSIEFLDSDFEKVSYLASLLTSRATGGDALNEEYEALRYELLSNNNVSSLLPDWLKIHRNLDSFWGFIQPKFGSYSDRRKFLSEEFSPVLNLLEFGHTIETQNKSDFQSLSSNLPNSVTQPMKKKVFLVHGRDNEAKQEVARYVESLGIDVIILHEQASSGMTIIEKIEHYANDADFAIVLYTACDHGRGIHETKVHPKNRARQNVIFEHGYLMAKLGRKNVCALVKGEIETPNDISGVVYVGLDSAGAWKTEVTKELNACGYNVVSFL
jgi:predicted nucleotide-binding protein